MEQELSELNPTGTLAGIEGCVAARRAAESEQLFLVLRWADLHSADPGLDPGRRPPGSDRLGFLGGDGTPGVRELALCELAVALQVHPLSARSLTADALDLRHRLPRVLERVAGGDTEVWVARKVASMTRDLPFEVMHLIDEAVAAAIGAQAPSRVFEIAEATKLEVDRTAHEERLAAERRKRFVGLNRRDDTGLRTVIARLSTADARAVVSMVDTVADLLADLPEHAETGRDELRSVAFGWLARPLELLRLLTDGDESEEGRALAEAIGRLDLTVLRPRTVLYVHVHETALAGLPGVARVEGLGPHLLAQVRDLLAHDHVTLKPVIDLGEQVSVNAYEHPAALAERIHLLRPGDQFPHASSMSRTLDLDHPVPYDPTGPPGQTSTLTSQPLGRTTHRAKTHLGYRAAPALPLMTGVVWRTPHGLTRLVDDHGTHRIAPTEADTLTDDDADSLDQALTRLTIQHRTGRLDHHLDRHHFDEG